MSITKPKSHLADLRKDFRHQLEQFYAFLNLAPPYHSLEKAIRYLSTAFSQKTDNDQKKLMEESRLKWEFYGQIFVESGLSQKHRGIIHRLVQSGQPTNLPREFGNFTKAFQAHSQKHD